MIELLSNLSVTEIIITVIMIAIAIKELITLISFFTKEIKALFNKERKVEDDKQHLLNEISEIKELIAQNEQKYNQLATQMAEMQNETRQMFAQQQETLDTLVESDVDDIKSYLVKQYHVFMAQEWIDDFSMDVIEKRFAHYQKEGGNSYAQTLVDKLRKLPNHPPA